MKLIISGYKRNSEKNGNCLHCASCYLFLLEELYKTATYEKRVANVQSDGSGEQTVGTFLCSALPGNIPVAIYYTR